jgi:hypothetical protein
MLDATLCMERTIIRYVFLLDLVSLGSYFPRLGRDVGTRISPVYEATEKNKM